MRYEDASHTSAFQGSQPIANDDLDSIPAGSKTPATGNLITGEGTQTGSAGADMAAGAHVAAIGGKGGEDTSFSGGKLSVAGEFGHLSVDKDGNYSYQANAGVENVRDRFTYTLADNNGATDTGSLIVEIGKTPVVIKANAQQIVPGPDGVVTLPPGVELSDIMVVGRNLVVNMPDGTQLIIVDGAIFVPQLELGGVEVPSTNLAALLIGQEPQPAAGESVQQLSSGGNFEVPVPPLDPGVPLGDLIPPTEYTYQPPEPQPVNDILDREPAILIQPDGQPASVAAVDSVDEDGLPTRNGGEPEGSDEGADGNPSNNSDTDEATSGTILIDSPDGVDGVTINGVLVTGAVGQVIQGAYGTLTITGFDGDNILYTYTLTDNTSGDNTHDDFSVVLTDDDGDTATATLTIDIVDDVPTARPDTDSIPSGSNGPATGNVITDAAPGDAGDSDTNAADTVGADNAVVTFIDSVNAAPGASVPGGGFVDIAGQYGTLRIYSNGDYSYTRGEGSPPGSVQDVFNYTITDGDGDTSVSTLTISLTDFGTTVDAPDAGEAGTVVSEVGLPERGGEPAGSGEIADGNGANNSDTSETTNGVINFSAPDGLGSVTIDGVVVTGAVGQTFAGTYGTLTVTSFNAATGQIGYSYTLADNTSGNNTSDDFAIVVTDSDGDAANDTLVINIIDDVPTADNDTDSLAAGTFGPETGNVITGVGTTSGAAGADVVGADDASITAIASVNVPANVDTDPSANFTIEGQYGVLTLDANGDYSYTRNPGTPGGVSDVFTYTLTDGDGDSDTATLTIDIGNAVPQTGENPTVLLDDDAKANGNPGGIGDDPDSANTVGTLSGSGGDGALTFAVLLTGEPAGFDYVSGGAGVVLIQQGGETKLTVTVNSDGSYTVVQNNPIEHAPGLDENNVQFTLNYTVTDADGDSANGSFNIDVDDDTPIALEGQVAGTVDEDGVPGGIAGGVGDVPGESAVASGSVASLFASGADVPLTYSLLADTSGLPALTSGGAAVTYAVVGDTLTASAGGHDVFTFVLNADGSYTFTLLDQLDHPAGLNENDLSISLGSIIQATDNDGDSVTANAGGLVITVDDDTPVATQTLLTGAVDEDGVPGGIAGGVGDVPGEGTVASGSVATLFASGADQPLSFSLLGDTSGLPALTSGGAAVTYSVVGNTLTASAGGHDVFTFVLNANGSYTFTLLDQLDHPTLNGVAGDNTENDLAIQLGSIIQATDADGDSVTANGNGLVITVDDDTPVANNDTDTIVGGNGPATGNVITGVDFVGGDANGSDGTADQSGADSPVSITAIASVNVPGNLDTDASANFTIAGQYGVLTLNANGDYSYLRNGGTPGGVSDTFTYTLTDADGDSVIATLTIGIEDHFPTAGNVDAVVDDDNAVGVVGNPGGPNDDAPSNASGNLPGSGGDGALTFDLLLTGAPAGFTYVDGPAGSVLVQQGGITVLTITINAATGAYTITENAPIVHPSLDGVAGDNTENNVSFTINYTVTDADNDVAPGTLNISVDDDTPVATATLLTGTVDEDGVLEGAADAGQGDGIAGGVGDVAGQAVTATGSVATLFSAGADSPLTYSLLTNTSGLPALTSGGVAVTYAVVGDTLTASAGVGNTVFTFVLNANGSYTFTLVDQLDHAAGNNENDLSIQLGSIIQATDHDGDSVTANANGLTITVDDDSPIATATQLTGTVDEDGVVENAAPGIQYGDGVAGGTGDVAGEVVSATGNVSTLFQSGADEPLTYALLNNFAGLTAQGLTSGGVALTYQVSLNAGVYTLTASAGVGNTVFTYTLNAATGAYNFTLVDQLDHPTLNGLAGDNTENDLAINLSSIIQATDFDGDSVAAGANGLIITVDDDMPVINSFTSPLQVDNDATPSATGNFDFDIGADENSDHDDIAVSNFAVSVNGVALDPGDFTLTPGLENATTASYTFSFDYDTGTGGTATSNGTLVFDKIAGTYTVELTNGPIEGFSILSTGGADASDFVSYQVPSGGSGSPEVTVAALDTDFFVQFSGVAEPGSGTGSDNLTTTTGAGGAFVPVTTASFTGLELFTQAVASIVVSSSAAGVGGNTIQGGEVLDLNLYATDPGGTLGGVPTQSSTSMFMALDGIGGAEDMIVVLKLYDTVTHQYTTKALIVQNGDILVQADAAALVGTPYEGLGAALDNNDGLIVIEANDYQEGNTNLVIVGAQIAGSDEGITGTGINLNGDVGGASSGTQAFSTDVSDAPFKITSIGFLTTSSEDQSAQISFDVTLEDFDGDAVTQHIDVNIGTSSPALLPPDPQFATTLSSESLLASDSHGHQLEKTAANSNSLTLAAAVAAAGVAEQAAAGPVHDNGSHNLAAELDLAAGHHFSPIISTDNHSSIAAVSNEAPAAANDSAPAASSSHQSAQAESDHALDNSAAHADAKSSDVPAANDQGPASSSVEASPAALAVGMPSVEALQAAGVAGHAQHGGSVEQIVADALGHGNASATVDALLNALPGGNGAVGVLANVASPAANAVLGGDMSIHGAFGAGHDMMMHMHVAMHHDAVQPAANG